MPRKYFVLDTNVILHDYKSIYNFEENDVVIPITVLEELDKFKKGTDLINFQAREFMRELDKISGDVLQASGIELGDGLGKLFIETGKKFSDEMQASFTEKTADHKILAVANYYHKEFKDRETVLVTQDINFRMKAKSLGIKSQDYETGKVVNLEALEKGIRIIKDIDNETISKLYKATEEVSNTHLNITVPFKSSEYTILKSANSSALAFYNKQNDSFRRIEKQTVYGITPRNAEQTFAIDALLNDNIQLVTIMGKAGTGKTLLALAAALEQRKNFHQIYLARPIIPLANRDIGYLPGDAKNKISPYMQPLFDNLSVIKHCFSAQSKEYQRIDKMLEAEKLLITPLAYIRGRTLSKIFFIVDEAQNLTPHEIKTIITRAGEGTKLVFTGDIQQIDSPYLDSKSNGLSYLSDRMEDQEIFAHVNLIKGERSDLADLAGSLL